MRLAAPTCCREVVRDGHTQPCDEPATHVAHDPEGLLFHAGGDWYPVCRRHRDQSLTGVHHHRPELRGLLVAGALSLAVMSA